MASPVTHTPKAPNAKALKQALKHYFGYDAFRGEQEAIVQNVLAGGDGFVIMPTGAGKSLCYQLPAVMSEGTTLVISPLIALMKNQVDQMEALGIHAGFLNSSMNKAAYEAVKDQARSGELKLLYVAPETLARPTFLKFLQEVQLSFVAIDEAHCISEWGHDFRPEYRKIRPTLDQYGRVPIMALTATATPKVQQDIQQNLGIEDSPVFKTSFNRENLYYEIRDKENAVQDLVRFIKSRPGKSGIIYCLSRKKVEELAEVLQMNGVQAVPYHAGFEAAVRSRHQDMFLQEEVQVVVATIAFGMGIDKPDVRFVIHYDVPKSIESYYQETGRAGRDGLEGFCVLYYDPADVNKLEKFMKDKPVSEREAGKHLLYEMSAFAESGLCRRKLILHYFGERYDEQQCSNMCDNCRYPKPTFNAKDDALLALQAIEATGGRFTMGHMVQVLTGYKGEHVQIVKHHELDIFGQGAYKSESAWQHIYTQLIVHDFLSKGLEDYGVLRLTEAGRSFIEKPTDLTLIRYQTPEEKAATRRAQGEQVAPKGDEDGYDTTLFEQLVQLRARMAEEHGKPSYVIFLEPSLIEMATKYPITMEELENIQGVGVGKARKFGQPIIKLIKTYVEEHGIQRPENVVVKTQGVNSKAKIAIINATDRKAPLDDVAESIDMDYEDLLDLVVKITHAGTKLDIQYYVNQVIDPDKQEEIEDYFLEADDDDPDLALEELGEDFDIEEIQLMRAMFYAKHAM